jgi:hypothetical protein
MIARIARVGSYSHELGMNADRQPQALRYHASVAGEKPIKSWGDIE